ncbi:MAG: DUF3619 family protein [Burkholderiaceae bacterium]
MKTLNSAELFSALASAQSQFALRVTARLSQGTEELPPAINERLRFARETALQHVRALRAASAGAPAEVGSSAGTLLLGGFARGWGMKLASLLPLIALVGGLVLIQRTQTESQISVAAEIDADLLADDLPPRAYGDAGFLEFLKLPKD